MSFLYPLLLAGAVTIALPIVLHMIRRHTRKRVTFSSLMFLRATAPRLRNRSRLEHIPLLIVRCLILCLLAFAFARPFLAGPIPTNEIQSGRRTVLLLDMSASMRRMGVWDRAVEEAKSVLADIGPADRVCVMSFDRGARTLVGFDQWNAMDLSQRTPAAIRSLATISPGWSSTNLGQALVTAAETIEDDEASADQRIPGIRRIVLISDLQQGSDLSALLAYQWPERVELAIKMIPCQEATNASLQLVTTRDPLAAARPSDALSVRITNSGDAAKHRFQLRWDPRTDASAMNEVYVPAGQSVVVQAPPRPGSSAATKLLLTGDDQDFDNTLYVAPAVEQPVSILYVGDDDPNDAKAMLYYARQAFTPASRVLSRSNAENLDEAEVTAASLVIVTDAMPRTNAAVLRQYLESGHTILFVMKSAEAAATLSDLTGIDNLDCREAEAERYAMLGSIDFKHPLLASFSDPRFGDFTRIHFWKHRRLDLGDQPSTRVLARFDNDAPAWTEILVGRGTLLVWTSGWNPADSDLALSSKFVPLLYSVLEHGGTLAERGSQYFVGDAVPASGEQAPPQADQPGIYTTQSPAGSRTFAVNLPPSESRTEPMAVEDVERMGIPLEPVSDVAPADTVQTTQPGSFAQMESQQKLWRWVLVAALAMLLIEIWLGGWLTRSAPGPEGEQS